MSDSDTDAPLPNPAEFLELVRAVATSANAATTVEQAMQTCLDRVCALTQWPVGHLYFCSKPPHCELQSTPVWHVDDPVWFHRFQELTQLTTFSSGIGLPGRVLATGSPAWITDVTSDPSFVRREIANELGIRAAFAFPILVGSEVVGVLEFFATDTVEPQEQLLEVMADIGAILGRVVERKRADEALRESEMKFRSVAQSAVDAIISSDSKGLITSWNRGAHLIFGYEEDEALGRPLTMLMPERYRDAHKQGMERVNSTGETHVIGKIVELHGLRKDGSEFPLELSLGSWQTAAGTFYSGVIRDITDRKRAEEEIKQLNADLERRVVIRTRRLQEANEELGREIAHRKRLEEQKDEFISIASHELRTPTTAIKGYIQLALRATEKTGNERLIRSLRIVDEKADQLTRLINDMLDVSRIERDALRLEPEAFDLAHLIEEVISAIKLTAPDFEYSVNLPGVPTVVWADRLRVEQVLTNLLDNAAKYVGRDSESSRRIEVAVTTSDKEAICSVRDYGVGIPADQQGAVFERFFRARNVTTARYPYPGFGLGLFISHSIISRHGGRMWIESTEGVGSTFYFSLPLVPGWTSKLTGLA